MKRFYAILLIFGKARFTVLTDRLIRMEWAEDSKFEDRATLGIINRDLDVPAFDVQKSKSKVVIKTKGRRKNSLPFYVIDYRNSICSRECEVQNLHRNVM